jgi:hypothetical protein
MAKAVAKVETKDVSLLMDNVPDYLKDAKPTGMEGLGQADFKVPRVKLLQALSPEIRSFPGKAIAGEFWHTTANKSLGSSFNMVPCIAGKKVIIYNDRDAGGGILAFSQDGRVWTTGGNQQIEVSVKGLKDKVKVHTKKDVDSSGLTEWGTSDPTNPKSAPMASLIYEYLCYLQDEPSLSPVVFGMYRTAVASAKNFNTQMLMTRKPIAALSVTVSAQEIVEGKNAWFVPSFELKGFVNQDIYNITKSLGEKYKSYTADYEGGVEDTASAHSGAPTEY